MAIKSLWHLLDTCNPWMANKVASILDEECPDLVHTNSLAGFSTLAWRIIKQRRLPLVHTLRDYYLLCPRSTMFRGGKNCETLCVGCRPYALFRELFSSRVDIVVGVSQFVLERHCRFGYFADIPRKRVIYNAYRREILPQSSKREWTIPVRFGYLGRLHPTKGVEALLEAVRWLPEGTWSLNIAGRGFSKYERYLRSRNKASGIRFSGYVKPENFFPAIDVLVVPSRWHEPFGRTVIEAYAHGVPVIGATRGGITELVEEGRTGFLFDPESPEELAAKMRRYIGNLELVSSMSSVCLGKAEDFLPENIVEQYLRVYGELLGKS